MSWLIAAWLRVVDLGSAELPIFERKYVVLTNTAAALSLLTTGLYLPLAWFTMPTSIFAVVAVQVPLYVIPLVLNAKGHHWWASCLLATTGLTFFAGQTVVFGPGHFHRYFIFAFVCAIPLAFGREHWRTVVLFLGLGLAALAALELAGPSIEPIFDVSPRAVRESQLAVVTAIVLAIMLISVKSRRSAQFAEDLATEAHARSERLLTNVFPAEIARRLKDNERVADRHDDVTVLFADLVGFTERAAQTEPQVVVDELARVFSAFDVLVDAHGLEKIKTIGDAYMVAGGLPQPMPGHATAVCEVALQMHRALDALDLGFQLRIGVHSGPVVAGVIGETRFTYDLWGDTVNMASRMESHGLPGRVHISAAVRERIGEAFELEPRGSIEVKGAAPMETYLLVCSRASPHANEGFHAGEDSRRDDEAGDKVSQ